MQSRHPSAKAIAAIPGEVVLLRLITSTIEPKGPYIGTLLSRSRLITALSAVHSGLLRRTMYLMRRQEYGLR